MKLTETKAVQSLKTIQLLEGVYMRSLPMAEMQKVIDGLANSSEENQTEVIDELFRQVIVDEKGEVFEDLNDNNATDILPINTIMEIVTAFQGAILPKGKK